MCYQLSATCSVSTMFFAAAFATEIDRSTPPPPVSVCTAFVELWLVDRSIRLQCNASGFHCFACAQATCFFLLVAANAVQCPVPDSGAQR